MGPAKGPIKIIRTDLLQPERVCEGAILVESLIHNIPYMHLPTVVRYDGRDILVEDCQQLATGKVSLGQPSRYDVVQAPYQCVSPYLHVVCLCKGDNGIRVLKRVEIASWMDGCQFHRVLWGDDVKLLAKHSSV